VFKGWWKGLSSSSDQRHHRWGLVPLVGVALFLAACGASSSTGTSGQGSAGNSPSSQSNATSGAGATNGGTPLRIGVIVNANGPLPSGEESAPPVLEAWAKATNAAGGVAGHPVQFVFEDTNADPSTAAADAQKLAGDQSVVGVVMFDAAAEGVVANTVTKAGLPVIGGMGYAPQWTSAPHWYPLTTATQSIFNMGMVLGKRLGGHTTALTICSESAECGAAEPIVKAASTKLGMKFAGAVQVSSSAPDYTAQCLLLKQKQVDYAMLGAAAAQAALTVAKDCKTQGYTPKWGLYGGTVVPKLIVKDNPGVPLSLALNAFPWFSNLPAVAKYRSLMQHEGVAQTAWGDPHGTAAYATMELFKKTLDANASSLAKAPTRQDIISAYGTVKDETLGGLLPQPVTFSATKPSPPIRCYWFGQFANGTFGQATGPVCDPSSLDS
jgi:branched-chain amino acid transport system substrate-binding protein